MTPTPRRPVHLIGVPLDLGSGRRGVDMGPSAVRIAGLADQLTALGYRVVDRGNVAVPIPEHLTPADPTKKFVDDIAEACRNLHELALDALRGGALPLVIGGDHSVAAGSVSATARWMVEQSGQPLGVIWVDAHGDMNTPQSTTSGNVHGMPLAALLGSEPAELAAVGGTVPAIRPEHTVLLGIRNLDEREKDRIRASGVHLLTMKDKGLEIVEVKIPYESTTIGRTVKDIALPARSFLTLIIRKGGKPVIPAIDTAFEAEDQLIVATPPESEEELQTILRGDEPPYGNGSGAHLT